MRSVLHSLWAAVVVATGALPSNSALPAEPLAPQTVIHDRAAAQRLLHNKGLTLQWIDWSRASRGRAAVTISRGVWSLRGTQAQKDGPGQVGGRAGEWAGAVPFQLI